MLMSVDVNFQSKIPIPEISISFSCSIPSENRIQIRNSTDAANTFRKIWKIDSIEYEERSYVLCLSRSNKVLGYFLHSVGGLTGTVMDAKQIIAASIKANSNAIIICHNHPSGGLTPSEIDNDITRRIVTGASYLDIIVLDHIILTESSFILLQMRGLFHMLTKGN